MDLDEQERIIEWLRELTDRVSDLEKRVEKIENKLSEFEPRDWW